MKVSKITVGRGKTMGPDGEEWDKEYYTIELEISRDDEVMPAREWARSLINGWLQETASKTGLTRGAKVPKQTERTIDDVTRLFPEDLAGMLTFDQSAEYILIKPRQYLGSDVFSRAAAIVRDQLGGEYISAGPDSHFRVSRGLTPPQPGLPPQLDPDELESLPWSSFREKDPQTGKAARVGRGQSGWILTKTRGGEALVDLIQKGGQDTPVTMGGGTEFLVRFGGEEEQFIQRRRKK